MPDERVMIFIDGSNLFKTATRLTPPLRLDYVKLRDLLVAGRKHVRTYFFGSIGSPPNEAQLKFHDLLKSLHFEVVIKPLKYRGKTEAGKPIYIEKGLDVALVTTMLSMAFNDSLDVAIIVGGDNDYRQAVDEVKRRGKRVEIASFEISTSREFKFCGDDYISLDEKRPLIELN